MARSSILRPTSARRLDAYRVALELVATVSAMTPRIARHDKDLARQISRAVSSAPNNLSEGMRRTGADRAHLLGVALGSTDETRSWLDVALFFPYISKP